MSLAMLVIATSAVDQVVTHGVSVDILAPA